MKTNEGVFLLLGLVFMPAIVHAVPTVYGFKAITNNSVIDPTIGMAQLSLTVDTYGTSQVLFSFSNSGAMACSITDIYIEDGILALDSIQNSDGVSFSEYPKPKNLSNGSVIGFNADKSLSADSDCPVQSNGVNPGEKVGLLFNLLSGYTYSEVVNRLNKGIGTTSDISGDIRVGIHVQGFSDGQSECFVLTPPTIVPVPSALMLAGIGVSCLWKMRREK